MQKLLNFLLLPLILILIYFYFILPQPKNAIISGNDVNLCPISKNSGNKQFNGKYYEDYILSKIFANQKTGSYINIGHGNPQKNSITQYFYTNGWRGINIEANKTWHQIIKTNQPEDVNLNLGVAHESGFKNFYRIYAEISQELNGFSTFDENLLDGANQRGDKYESTEVQIMTLNEILHKYSLESIDFIALNVRHKEREVLAGLNLNKYRPSIIIIDTPEPQKFNLHSYKWDEYLSNHKYHLIMFDGFKSYYIANEKYHDLYKNFLEAYSCVTEVNMKEQIVDTHMILVTKLIK